MKERDKNRKTGLSDFLRYRKDKLTNSEKNAFEKELQKDPFAMEAEEGLSGIDPEIVKRDIELLNKKIKLRTGRSGRYTLYRIAASIAALIVVSTLFLIVQRNVPTKEEKISGIKSEALILKEEPVKKIDRIADAPHLPVSAGKMKPAGVALAAPEKSAEKSEVISTVEFADSLTIDEKVNAIAVNELTEADAVRLKDDTSTKKAAEPEAELRAQTVAAGFGEKKARNLEAAAVSRSETFKDDATARYKPAEPVNGMESYYKYIEKNIQRPDTLKESGQLTVIISFIVKISGSPAAIKIIESPGKPFSDEAVRLIKEGPLWKPASENGVIKEEEVTVKISFK